MVKVSSVAVFNADGKLLFGRRKDNGKWTLPGGKSEEGESPEETATRELREEAGLTAEIMGYLGAGQVGKSLVVHAFKAVVGAEEPHGQNDPDEEVEEWRWVDVTDGLPKTIASNLHSPRNVTLGLLGLMARQPEPVSQKLQMPEESSFVPVAKTEEGVALTETLTSFDHLVPEHLAGAHLVVDDRGNRREAMLIKDDTVLARAWGRLGAVYGLDAAADLRGLMRDAMGLAKSEPQHPDPVLQELYVAFHGPVGGKPNPKALRDARYIPPRILAEALDPDVMRRRPESVAAILSRPDVDSEYLARAAESATRSYNVSVMAAVANNPRLPANRTRILGLNLINHPTSEFPERAARAKAVGTLVRRQDLDAEDFRELAAGASIHPDMGQHVKAALKANPERAKELAAVATEDYRHRHLIPLLDLDLTPQQAERLTNTDESYYKDRLVQNYVLQRHGKTLPLKALKELWDADHGSAGIDYGGGHSWTPELVGRLPKDEVKKRLMAPETLRHWNVARAGIMHPEFTEQDVRDIMDARSASDTMRIREGVLAPNISEDYRRELWNKDPFEQRELVHRMPPSYVKDFLSHQGDVAVEREMLLLAKRPDLTPQPESPFPGDSGTAHGQGWRRQ
jgi:ADP-ribose pyrophosphatase YjhB (NUDIX family)